MFFCAIAQGRYSIATGINASVKLGSNLSIDSTWHFPVNKGNLKPFKVKPRNNSTDWFKLYRVHKKATRSEWTIVTD